MKSLKFADELRKLADYLYSRPELEISSATFTEFYKDKKVQSALHFYDREQFVAAVKTLGSAKKEYTSPESDYSQLKVTPENYPALSLYIARDKVCRKVTKYECEPLFSTDEVEAL